MCGFRAGRVAAGVLFSFAFVAFVACMAGTGPKIQMGPNAVTTPDGLHLVDNVATGTLYIKPDYQVGSYDGFVLGKTAISFAEGSRQLDDEQQNELVEIFENVARETIENGGTPEAERAGPCVSLINLRLEKLAFEGTIGTASIGAVTLVIEIRDGYTNEPLLGYGQRRRLGTGSLSASFKRFASRFQRDFNNSLPPPDPTAPYQTCQDRAGAG